MDKFLLILIVILQLAQAKSFSNTIEERNQLVMFLSELDKFWRDPEVPAQCGEKYPALTSLENVGNEYLQCHLDLLKCYKDFSNSQNIADIFPIESSLFNKVQFQEVSINDRGNYTLTFQGIEKYEVVLPNNCHVKKLPKGIFAYPREHDAIFWDNNGRDIFFDRFYVTNQDVREWRIFTKKKITQQTKGYLPATNLSLEERSQFCKFRGKEVLSADIYYAAVFGEVNLQSWFPKPYYWSRSQSSSIEDTTKESDCSFFYTKECLRSKDPLYFANKAVTWSGFKQAQGYYPEIIANLEGGYFLVPSSFYLRKNSELHSLQKRVEVSSLFPLEIVRRNTLSTAEQDELSLLKEVAFRCYEEK